MKLFLLGFLLCIATISFGQQEDVAIQEVNGQPCYVHIVQAGNTLYGIHTTYNVPVNEIVQLNPGVEGGLQIGEVVYVPVPKNTQVKTHTVQKGETLFGISKQYDITIDQLREWNPSVNDGLKKGQVLQIHQSSYAHNESNETINPFKEEGPAELSKENPFDQINVVFKDSVVEHKVKEEETFYSISKRYMVSVKKLMQFNNKQNTNIHPGDILSIPLKKERIEKVPFGLIVKDSLYKEDSTFTLEFKEKEEYTIAILLPFFLDRGKGYNEKVSDISAQFYMGAKMALDSLERIGFKGKILVYDTKNDSSAIASILAKKEFEEMDLIIGPLYRKNVFQVAEWAKNHHVRMVCPGTVDAKILQNNRLVYAAVPSDVSLMRGLATYTINKHTGDRIILIKPKNKSDSILYEAFRNRYNELADSIPNASKLIETSPNNYGGYLTRSQKVVLVYPSNDKSAVMKFFNRIGKIIHKTHEKKTFIFGTADWMKYDINSYYKNRFQLTFADGMELDYTKPVTKYYLKKYRNWYNAAFTKMAVQGFDVTFNYCNALLNRQESHPLIMNYFQCSQVGLLHGYENTNYFIFSQVDFELINKLTEEE